jgi:hypothetical protein
MGGSVFCLLFSCWAVPLSPTWVEGSAPFWAPTILPFPASLLPLYFMASLGQASSALEHHIWAAFSVPATSHYAILTGSVFVLTDGWLCASGRGIQLATACVALAGWFAVRRRWLTPSAQWARAGRCVILLSLSRNVEWQMTCLSLYSGPVVVYVCATSLEP